jgi:hypothetical protein
MEGIWRDGTANRGMHLKYEYKKWEKFVKLFTKQIITYTFQIYLRSQLRIYWCYFYSLCSQHVLATAGHLQVKYNYIAYISWESHRYYNRSVVIRYVYRKADNKRQIVKQRIRCNIDGFLKICKWCNCISPEVGPQGPKHVVNRENKSNTINSQLRSLVYLKGIRILKATECTPQG